MNISNEREEITNICFVANHKKKKNVSNSESESDDKMSYFELQVSLENPHGETKDAFKRLTSNKRIIS